MARKPQNHVTRGLEAFFSGDDISVSLPVLERHAIERLEELFPPRCLARSENAEDHLRYAGKVELVEQLRATFENKLQTDDSASSIDPVADGEDAQNA